MSEERPVYITDALEMMGVMEPKKIITEVSGFIPVFEVVLHHYKDYMTALVFGRMWQYCNMSDGVCRASLERIGNDLEVSAVTVMRHAEKLVQDGYLIDTTPDRRNAPHEYLDGRKVEMKGRITAGMTKSNATVINSNATVINSQLIKQDYTNNTNGGKPPMSKSEMPLDWQLADDSPVIQQDNTTAKMIDAANILDTGCAGAGALGLAFMKSRGIIIPDGKIKGNRKAAREMLQMGVKPEHVSQATADLIQKGMTVTDLFSVSKTAISLANPAQDGAGYNPLGLEIE